MVPGLWSEVIEPKANRRLLPPAPSPREGVWGWGNVSRRSPFTQSTKKPSQKRLGVLSCDIVDDYRTVFNDMQKVLEFIDWLNENDYLVPGT